MLSVGVLLVEEHQDSCEPKMKSIKFNLIVEVLYL